MFWTETCPVLQMSLFSFVLAFGSRQHLLYRRFYFVHDPLFHPPLDHGVVQAYLKILNNDNNFRRSLHPGLTTPKRVSRPGIDRQHCISLSRPNRPLAKPRALRSPRGPCQSVAVTAIGGLQPALTLRFTGFELRPTMLRPIAIRIRRPIHEKPTPRRMSSKGNVRI